MAENKKEGGGAGMGARLLIIIYALAIIAIGAYPIQQEFGGVKEFIQQKVASLVDGSRFERIQRDRAQERQRAQLGRRSPFSAESRSKPATAPAEVASEGEQRMDELTDSDRQELDDLLSSVP